MVKFGCYLASVAGALTAGSLTAGTSGLLIAAVLVVIATPVIGFTCSQFALTQHGRRLASTVAEVRQLKEAELAALVAFFSARPDGLCGYARQCQVLRPSAYTFQVLPGGDAAGRPAIAASGQPSWSGLNCSIFLADIAAFGGHCRNDRDRLFLRTAMYAMLRHAFENSGVLWEGCHREDRGDGALFIVPPGTPTSLLLDPMSGELATALAAHNDQVAAARRMQLRIALHVGPVVSDPEGVSGESVIVGARLLDAPVLKRQLAGESADLGLIVSAYVYDTVVKHAPGTIDPTRFHRVRVRLKESRLTAWTCLLGSGAIGLGSK